MIMKIITSAKDLTNFRMLSIATTDTTSSINHS